MAPELFKNTFFDISNAVGGHIDAASWKANVRRMRTEAVRASYRYFSNSSVAFPSMKITAGIKNAESADGE